MNFQDEYQKYSSFVLNAHENLSSVKEKADKLTEIRSNIEKHGGSIYYLLFYMTSLI